ncbi:MAG TPA: pinensin family lanthipeptide, partial [Longimicrobiaceae bacterium]|nr:pinensin family lanthipeptide [Longimicrobiaceae bacterium]
PMNKLTLDDLQVESFATSDAMAAERGTVHGQAAMAWGPSKPSCISCYGPTDPCICDPPHGLTELC